MSDDLLHRAAKLQAECKREFELFRANADQARAQLKRYQANLTDIQVMFLRAPRRRIPGWCQLHVIDGGRR
jgi:hypothetical protein